MATKTSASLRIDSAGAVIKALREQKPLTLESLAERLGWDKGRLSKYENNHLAVSMPVIEDIADALEMDPFVLTLKCLRHRYPALNGKKSKPGRLLTQLEQSLSE